MRGRLCVVECRSKWSQALSGRSKQRALTFNLMTWEFFFFFVFFFVLWFVCFSLWWCVGGLHLVWSGVQSLSLCRYSLHQAMVQLGLTENSNWREHKLSECICLKIIATFNPDIIGLNYTWTSTTSLISTTYVCFKETCVYVLNTDLEHF